MEKENYILVGGAWIYANNSAHIGHITGLIAGDVIARYHRLKKDKVCYISGTDCHGTPITQRALRENILPGEISGKYHNEFKSIFEGLNFSYDYYSKTDDNYHKKEVEKIFNKLYKNGYIYEKNDLQAYCDNCKKFLSDRELEILCKKCNNYSNSDQCDCGNIPDNDEIKEGICSFCKSKVNQRENKNLYFSLSKFQDDIERYVEQYKNKWRKNTINETEKYLKNKLNDRVISRDLSWGVDIPLNGYEDKKIYVWIEAVLGYITATRKIFEKDWKYYWKEEFNPKIYFVHGKDNIVFHSIILPALLLGIDEGYILPQYIISSEFLTVEGEKISKSKGNVILVKDLLKKFSGDEIRYYFIRNSPENKDVNFTLTDFKAVCNSDLNNKLGNFVNRTLNFKGNKKIKVSEIDSTIKDRIKSVYYKVEKKLLNLEIKSALHEVNDLISFGNIYYDENKPWIKKKEDIEEFEKILFNCTEIIFNLTNLLEPFIPNTCEKVRKYLNKSNSNWFYETIENDIEIINIKPLFKRH